VVPFDDCNDANSYDDNIDNDAMICVISTFQGSCVGDSGGPAVMVSDPDDFLSDIAVGVISFGPPDCIEPNKPTVLARVSSWNDGIETTICTHSNVQNPRPFFCPSTPLTPQPTTPQPTTAEPTFMPTTRQPAQPPTLAPIVAQPTPIPTSLFATGVPMGVPTPAPTTQQPSLGGHAQAYLAEYIVRSVEGNCEAGTAIFDIACTDESDGLLLEPIDAEYPVECIYTGPLTATCAADATSGRFRRTFVCHGPMGVGNLVGQASSYPQTAGCLGAGIMITVINVYLICDYLADSNRQVVIDGSLSCDPENFLSDFEDQDICGISLECSRTCALAQVSLTATAINIPSNCHELYDRIDLARPSVSMVPSVSPTTRQPTPPPSPNPTLKVIIPNNPTPEPTTKSPTFAPRSPGNPDIDNGDRTMFLGSQTKFRHHLPVGGT